MNHDPLFTRRIILCLLVSAFLTAPAAAGVTATDREIVFWQARVERDTEDHISPCTLGAAYLQKARESGDFSYYKKAEDALHKSLSIQPEYTRALAMLASAYNSQHNFKAAIPLAERALGFVPDDPYTLGILGDAFLETGDIEKAQTFYGKLLKAAPSLFAYSRQANLQQFKGDNEGAIASLAEAIEQASTAVPAENVAWCQVQLGGIYFASGDLKRAQEYYEQALKTLPEYYQALERMAELHAAKEEFAEAIALYRRVIDAVPRPEFQQALGDVYVYKKEHDEARKWHALALAGYQKAVEAGNVHYYHHLSSFFADIQPNPAEALKWARKDLELRQNIYAYDALAWALHKNGESAEAVAAMRKALALGTKDSHLFFHAGMILLRAGNADEAQEFTKRAYAVNPAFEKFHAHR